MSDFDWLDDDDDDSDEPHGRDALAQARTAARKSGRRVKDLETELNSVKALLRERLINDAVTAKGLDPRIAKLIPKDLETDALDEFLGDFADLFPKAPADSDEPDSGDQDAPDDGADAGPDLSGLAAVQAQGAQGTPPRGDATELAARIAAAKDVAELNQLIHGNPNGPAAY